MLTSGFFNSINGDRVYDADEFNSLFNGILADGVFASSGSQFRVLADGSYTVYVQSGQARFHGIWVQNDDNLPLTLNDADPVFGRIDVVYLEINKQTAVRAASVGVLQGIPQETPSAPSLPNQTDIYSYELGRVYVASQAGGITQSNVTNYVGLSGTPFATGLLDQVSVDDLLIQWSTEFTEWFENVRDQLSEDAAGNLQNEIDVMSDSLAMHDHSIFTDGSSIGPEGLKTRTRSIYRAGSAMREIPSGDDSDLVAWGSYTVLPYDASKVYTSSLLFPEDCFEGSDVDVYLIYRTTDEDPSNVRLILDYMSVSYGSTEELTGSIQLNLNPQRTGDPRIYIMQIATLSFVGYPKNVCSFRLSRDYQHQDDTLDDNFEFLGLRFDYLADS